MSVMTGQQIADEFGTSRQNIYKLLKKGMRKVYKRVKKMCPDYTPFDVAVHMSVMFRVDKEKDLQYFIKDFPKDLQEAIKKDGARRLRG
jgi:predicted DNA-binding protein YlxM (UPF0122 family)